MSGPMPLEERIRRANVGRSAKARTRRFQKAVREMRETGLGVQVVEPVDVDGVVSWRPAADYTEEAIAAASGR